jgi:hypothetical protein
MIARGADDGLSGPYDRQSREAIREEISDLIIDIANELCEGSREPIEDFRIRLMQLRRRLSVRDDSHLIVQIDTLLRVTYAYARRMESFVPRTKLQLGRRWDAWQARLLNAVEGSLLFAPFLLFFPLRPPSPRR